MTLRRPSAQELVSFTNHLDEASYAFTIGNYARANEILATAKILVRDLYLQALQGQGVNP